METTVTMSLDRYKELEAFEKSIIAISNSKRFLLYSSYHHTVYLDGDEITEQLIQDVQRMQKRVDRIRDAIKDKFPKVYEQLHQEIWL